MRTVIALLGLFLVVAGISGTIDHLTGQPFLSGVLNVFNRRVIPNVEALDGYELYANLCVGAFGAVLMVVTQRARA
ncbi:MAG TPA: hypothetical protein VNP92_12390 [Actinophytocola sp.]|nr:hypothetical protein [Actinophytocola sp.]